jgi:cyclopropane fatty-acyl-phospholipid synthase-like methyltransferase
MIDESELARRFPRSQQYAPEWVCENGMGGHPLWQTEWLCETLPLEPGMRVLDLGCGRAKSSIFLAREFGVEVWATDLWVAATENWQRVREAGLESRVFPLHADARALPFAADFFDAIVAVDCYSYFGTDDLYLNYLVQFVKSGGAIGIAGAGLTHEMPSPVPEHLRTFWSQDLWCLHSAAWWRRHWERTGLVEIATADTMADGWKLWSHWHRVAWPHNTDEIEALEVDAGRYLGYIRVVGRRTPGTQLAEYAWPDNLRSWPVQFEKRPILRDAPAKNSPA